MQDGQASEDRPRADASRRRRRLLIVLGIVVLIAIGIWLITKGGGDSGSSSSSGVRSPEAVTPAELSEVAGESKTPIYWAGDQPESTIELSETEGRTYVRYLTEGAEPGDARPNFLTVGSYQFADPVAALEKLAENPGGVKRTVPGGGVAFFNHERPQNVYLAYPDEEVQIEVYDPDPKVAKKIVTSGQIVPVG